MMRSMLAVILLLALAMSAGAYDILYSNDTAATHEAGVFGIRGSFLYFTADSKFTKDGGVDDLDSGREYTRKWFPIDIYYGVPGGLEIGVTPIFMMDTRMYAKVLNVPVPDETGTGIGDTWIWAKYGILPEPVLTARVGVKVPTGNHEILKGEYELALGTGQMDIDGAIMFGVPLPDGFFDGSIGYRYRMVESTKEETDEEDDYKFGNEIHFYAGYTHFLGDAINLRLGADGFFGSDPTEGGEPIPDEGSVNPDEFETGPSAVYINPGFNYIMDSGMALGVDFYYPLMGANIDGAWGFGLSLGWGG